MYQHPKTISIFLTSGDPSGIKTAELSGWIGKALVIPRDKLTEAKERIELSQPAIYFLFGKNQEDNNLAYIGEAESVYTRINTHNFHKDFWDIAVVIISQNNSLDKADIKYLESLALTKATENKRYLLENSKQPSVNNLDEKKEAAANEFLHKSELLLSTLGYPILKDLPKSSESNVYYLDVKGTQGKGVYSQNDFLLLKGSIARFDTTPAYGGKAERTRKILSDEGLWRKESDHYVLLEDYLCSSPSLAAAVLAGRPINGWTTWKDDQGNTLDQNERVLLESE